MSRTHCSSKKFIQFFSALPAPALHPGCLPVVDQRKQEACLQEDRSSGSTLLHAGRGERPTLWCRPNTFPQGKANARHFPSCETSCSGRDWIMPTLVFSHNLSFIDMDNSSRIYIELASLTLLHMIFLFLISLSFHTFFCLEMQ